MDNPLALSILTLEEHSIVLTVALRRSNANGIAKVVANVGAKSEQGLIRRIFSFLDIL